MSVEFNQSNYTTSKGILAFPEPYVCVAHTFKQNDPAAVTIDGRKIIQAGTIYPSNDASAQGVVFNDVDVTNGDRTAALLIFGFIKKTGIPVQPTTTALAALKMVAFLPLAAVAAALTANKLTIAVGEAANTVHDTQVSISGVHFREEASNLSNWTITGESTTKVSVTGIDVDPSGAFVTIHTKNTAAAVAGNVTVIPKAAATSTGDVPTDAATIATVA